MAADQGGGEALNSAHAHCSRMADVIQVDIHNDPRILSFWQATHISSFHALESGQNLFAFTRVIYEQHYFQVRAKCPAYSRNFACGDLNTNSLFICMRIRTTNKNRRSQLVYLAGRNCAFPRLADLRHKGKGCQAA